MIILGMESLSHYCQLDRKPKWVICSFEGEDQHQHWLGEIKVQVERKEVNAD